MSGYRFSIASMMATTTSTEPSSPWWQKLGKGLKTDLRRFRYYLQDFTDGVTGKKTWEKVLATTAFLYFAVLLPVIATGVVNAIFTHGKIGLYQVLLSEIIGGLSWTFLSGQPLVIISNTLVVAFYNKVIYDLAEYMEVDFGSLYACAGLWSSLFLIHYSISNLSDAMKKLKRSIKEIYTAFVALAFVRSAAANIEKDVLEKSKEETMLSILLMISTTWLALKLCQIKDTLFFNQPTRELISSYGLPISIISTSVLSYFIGQDMNLATLEYDQNKHHDFPQNLDHWEHLNVQVLWISAGLGFCLSLVFL